MANAQLPLTALRAFEASARLLSFKSAAAELHVTPTAISHQIQHLERLLGVELFSRVHRGLELTPAATACLPQVRDGFAALRAAVDTMCHYGDTGALSVSCPPSFAMRILMPLTHGFLAQHPDVDLRLTTRMREPISPSGKPPDERDTLLRWAEESDLIIVFGRDEFDDIEAERIMPLDITLVCSPDLLKRHGGLNRARDVANYPWLHDDRGLKYSGQPFWDRWLCATRTTADDTARGIHYTHAAMAIDAAVHGQGLLVTTPCLCQRELDAGLLVAPFELRVRIDQSYYLLHRRTNRAAVGLFKTWLHNAISQADKPTKQAA